LVLFFKKEHFLPAHSQISLLQTRPPTISFAALVLWPDETAPPSSARRVETIRAAFGRGEVDLSVCGDVEDVEIELGLRTHRVTPARRYNVLEAFGRANFDAPVLAPPVQRQPKPKLGRNEKCLCGSGKKYKKCCLG
jgi:hypothetical protein